MSTRVTGSDQSPSQPVASSLRVRPARLADAAAIAAIYNREVLESTATFDLTPRSLDEQQRWIEERSGAFAALVAEDLTLGEIRGFAALSPYKPRAAYNTTVESSVYVAREHVGTGVGRVLMDALIEAARSSGFHAIIARVEASGAASRALHTAVGFELVGIEREIGRKFGRWLSVAVMQRLLGDPAAAGDR